ncbi:unnamed protein product [Staurois parvus]|uniref:Uncharacterized protein n=1 Tax=Staurois parvus TaxID=386267 RepID=A0ABN9GKB6_9NEOB|nr:unnamed protein product [Staurois parvus]
MSPSPHSAMCHFSGISHTLLVCSIFFIGLLYGLPLMCLHRHTVAPNTGFGPVTGQMSEVCGDSKIDGTSSACHTD